MVRHLELSLVQQLLWERIEAEEMQTLRLILAELGGKLSEPWQFDRSRRVFWMNAPEPVEPDGPNPNPTDV